MTGRYSPGSLMRLPSVAAVPAGRRKTSEFLEEFRNFFGPTMNAFEAAERAGRSEELQRELQALFETQNQETAINRTSIPATYLAVTVQVV
jgi:hypothetical protein